MQKRKKRMIIYWLSRHQCTAAQWQWLLDRFGEDIELSWDSFPFTGAGDIAQRLKKYKTGERELVLVALMSVYQDVLDLGIRPIRAVMRESDATDPSAVEENGRWFTFVTFKRVTKIRFDFVAVEARPVGRVLWLSQHSPVASQRAELIHLFGSAVEIVENRNVFRPVEELKDEILAGGYEVVVAVAPMDVLTLLRDPDGRYDLLWSQMRRVSSTSERPDILFSDKMFVFEEFRTIALLEWIYEEV